MIFTNSSKLVCHGFQPKRVLAFVGFSGSGKSTILKLICNLIAPDIGEIETSDGDIAMVFDTLHAITLTSSPGTEILIHIGLDTVTLKGAPFTAHVAAGDQVKKGDLLMDVDLDKITGAGLNTVTPVLICNTDDDGKISLKKEGEVSLDEAVLSIS